jgi:hypothetical protein
MLFETTKSTFSFVSSRIPVFPLHLVVPSSSRWCLHCLLWRLWRERNDISFEDHERTLKEFTSFFFKTLYIWTIVYISSLSISYSDLRCFLLYTSYVLRGALYF